MLTYRRLFVLLRRDGEVASRNKVYRLYRAEGLAVRKRKGRRRAVGTRAPLAVALQPNARWSLDFVHDQLACGRRFRILNVVDDATRECLLAVADTSISGKRVARELTALVARRGRPRTIVSDNGTEFTSNAVLAWCESRRRRLALHRPGQADAERLLRELQRPHARRAPERDAVPGSSPCPREARELGRRLQHQAAPLGARLSRHRRRRPPSSPQRAIGCATPTSFADRPLLHPRQTAYHHGRL